MYRVVIVDDEEPVLDSFSFILDKECKDFSLCGKARSGTEAVRLITDVRPDLVFMDIQMPGIDGIDAITQIRDRYPEIVFILATAYERFDIAQRAIPLGVFSYLVKPISRRALLGELDRVKLHLDQHRQNSGIKLQDVRFLQKTKEEIKSRFLGSLAWGNPSSEDWELFSSLFSLKTDRGAIRIVDIRDELPPVARDTIFEELQEKMQFKFNCFHARIAGRLLLFFPEDQSLDRLDPYLRKVKADFGPIDLVIGKGGICHYSQLSSAFEDANRSFEDSTVSDKNYATEQEEMQAICAAILRLDFRKGLPLFEDFWVRAFREDQFDVAKAKMVGLFTLLLSRVEVPLRFAAYSDLNPAEAIMRLRNVEEWRRWSTEIFGSLQKTLQRRDARSLPQHLSTALAIIDRTYNEPIQLSSIAEECEITASYLCRLFTEHLGISFVEYLTKYRMERAMALLRDKNSSIKEASNLVGFQDPNYFSRIFRRYVGLSPSDFVSRRRQ